MSNVFPPRKDSELATTAPAFSAKITATPTAFGLTSPAATALASATTAFVNAYDLAVDPATRTKATVAAKDTARQALLALLRADIRIIQATPSVTDAQRESLGLPIHHKPSPVPTPALAPQLTVVSAVGTTVRIRLDDATAPSRRGKPDGVSGAAVFSFVGDNPPASLSAWISEGNTTRTTFDVAFPDTTAPGAKVWFRACWFNPRLQNGPTCDSVPTRIPGRVAEAA